MAMFKSMTHPLARWLAVVSIAWLVLAPTALRIASAVLLYTHPWEQICTSLGEQSVQLPGASSAHGTSNHDGGCCGGDCPLCVLCHLGSGALAPAAIPVVCIPWDGSAPLMADTRPPSLAWPWALQNPRAPPAYF